MQGLRNLSARIGSQHRLGRILSDLLAVGAVHCWQFEIDATWNDLSRFFSAKGMGVNMSPMPDVDPHLNHRGRVQEALKLLELARKDILEGLESKSTPNMLAHSIERIDRAIALLKIAMGSE
jgi:hypothetical protein